MSRKARLQEARQDMAGALTELESEIQLLTGKPIQVAGRWLLPLTGFALGFWWGHRLFQRNVKGGRDLRDG